MAFGSTMLVHGRIGPFLTVFFYMFTEWPGGLSNVRRFASWVGTGPLIDNALFEGRINFVFGMHEHWFDGVLTLETNLNVCVSEQLFERFTETWKIRC